MSTEPLHVIGTIHPPATSEKTEADDLTKAEMVVRENDLVGRPVLVEHDGAPVGEVLTSWIHHDTGSLKMAANINDPNVQAQVKSGQMRGLSIGSKLIHPVGTDASRRVSQILDEVSVCEKPRRHGCYVEQIDYVPVLEHMKASKRSGVHLFLTLSRNARCTSCLRYKHMS